MSIGMLWFDDSSTPLAEKIRKAAAYYQKKYGRAAELVLVNPSMMTEVNIEGLTIIPYRPVLPGHIWIGYEEMPIEKESEA